MTIYTITLTTWIKKTIYTVTLTSSTTNWSIQSHWHRAQTTISTITLTTSTNNPFILSLWQHHQITTVLIPSPWNHLQITVYTTTQTAPRSYLHDHHQSPIFTSAALLQVKWIHLFSGANNICEGYVKYLQEQFVLITYPVCPLPTLRTTRQARILTRSLLRKLFSK